MNLYSFFMGLFCVFSPCTRGLQKDAEIWHFPWELRCSRVTSSLPHATESESSAPRILPSWRSAQRSTDTKGTSKRHGLKTNMPPPKIRLVCQLEFIFLDLLSFTSAPWLPRRRRWQPKFLFPRIYEASLIQHPHARCGLDCTGLLFLLTWDPVFFPVLITGEDEQSLLLSLH